MINLASQASSNECNVQSGLETLKSLYIIEVHFVLYTVCALEMTMLACSAHIINPYTRTA